MMRAFRWVVLALLVRAAGLSAQDGTEAWAMLGRGDPASALTAARSALLSNSSDPGWNCLAGRSLVALERYDEAIPHLKRVLRAGDAQPFLRAWAANDLGLALFARGDADGARQVLNEAVAMAATQNATASARGRLRRLGLDSVYASWQVLETEHLRARFSPTAPAAERPAWLAARERAFARSTEFFGGAPAKKIDILVWGSLDEAKGIAAVRVLGFADPALAQINTLWNQTDGHEITHVVSYQALHPVKRTLFINEGLGVAFNGEELDRLGAARTVLQHAGSRPLDLLAFWSADERQPPAVLYTVGGAFIEYLLQHGGRDRLLQLAREQTPEAARRIYGSDFAALVSGFEREINAQ